MLLYRHEEGHYLAVPPAWRFEAAAGYACCFAGEDVPDIICQAFIRESGGYALRGDDVIALQDDARRCPRAGIASNTGRSGTGTRGHLLRT